MLLLLQQAPFVVEVLTQPEPTRDISIDVVLGMFEMAGVVLLAAAVGGLIAGAIFVAVRRMKDASGPPTTDTGHVRLRI